MNVVLSSDFPNGCAGIQNSTDFPALSLGKRRTPPGQFTSCSRSRNAGDGSLSDQRLLEFGKRGEDMEYQLTARRRRIYAFSQGHEADSTAFQSFDHGNQMGDRPSETIKPPDDQNIAASKRLQHRSQAASLLEASRDAVVFEYTFAPRQTKGVSLQIKMLVNR